MASIRAIAHCIGLTGQISVMKDFYGYRTKIPVTLSLLKQVRLIRGKHIHLNLIRTATFDSSQQKEIDYGLQTMRNIYATMHIGIGRIQRFFIPPGHEAINGNSEFHDLINEYSVSNNGIDVFLVRTIAGSSSGKSPETGSCDKGSKDDSGCAIAIEDNIDGIGFTIGQAIAHEAGHYLGLPHEDELPDNLMFPTIPNGGRLYGGQGGVMVMHCTINGGCGT